MSYTFHSDPGHGWLEVTIKELQELNIAGEITGCSAMEGNRIYLEEDCDLTTFFNAKYPDYTEPNDQRVWQDIEHKDYNNLCFIRDLPDYQIPSCIR